MRSTLATALVLALAATAGAAYAQAARKWSATSSTAMGITGDVTFSPKAFTAAGQTFPLAKAATIANYNTNGGAQNATVYKVTKPSNPKLLRGNQLCSAPVTWMVTWMSADGAQLNVDAFSGPTQPTANSENTSNAYCGGLMYSK